MSFTLLSCAIIFMLVLYFGSKLGGLGIAFTAGLGIFLITMVIGVPPGNIPTNVIFIIIPVIASIAVLELAGGLDYMVYIADKILRNQPKYINILAPLVTFTLTVLVGTGHAVYSLLPVIVEVARKNNIKPVNPLSSAAIASQIAITSSPISAAIVAFCGYMANINISLIQVLMVTFPANLIAIILVGVIQSFRKQSLFSEKDCSKLLDKYEGKHNNIAIKDKPIQKTAKISVILFILGICSIVLFAAFPNLKPTYADNSKIGNAHLIMIVVLSISLIIILVSKIKVSEIVNQKTFKAGITATICIIGLAWIGDTIIRYYTEDIKMLAQDVLKVYPWLFVIIIFFVAMFLYSQVTTVVTLFPLAMALQLPPLTMVASLVAVNALFIIPTYPTVVAATQLDYTGTTKIGKYILNHSFLFPGVLMIIFSVILGYLIGSIVIS